MYTGLRVRGHRGGCLVHGVNAYRGGCVVDVYRGGCLVGVYRDGCLVDATKLVV